MFSRVLFKYWILITSVAIFLIGCSNENIISNPDDVRMLKTKSNIEDVVFWHTYGDEESRVFEKKLIPLFEKKYPNIHIISVRQPYNQQLKPILIARASAHKIPDVVRMDIKWVPEFAQLGLLYPVSQFSDFNQIKIQLHPSALATNYYHGKYFGMPLDVNTKVAIFNRKLLEEAGYNQPPESMEKIFQIALKHHYVIGMKGVQPWESLPYFLAMGGKLTDSNYTKASGYLDSKTSIEAVQKLLYYYQKGILNPQLYTDQADTWNGIIDGNFFMIDEGPWFYSILSNTKGSNVDLMKVTWPLPFPYSKGNASIIGGESLVIMKGTKHLQAAWTFLKWMTNQSAQEEMYKTGLIPTNKNAMKLGNSFGNTFIDSYLQALKYPFLRPTVKNWDKIGDVYSKHLENIFFFHQSVPDQMHLAAKEIDQLLKDTDY